MPCLHLLLVVSALAASVKAFIEIIGSGERYPDRTADFGPRFTSKGHVAYLIPIELLEPKFSHGCVPVSFETSRFNYALDQIKGVLINYDFADRDTRYPWIALVERGKCSFASKVRAMQQSGASAVIIGDNRKGGLLKMYANDNATDINIPTAFVMKWEYQNLKYQAMEAFAEFFTHRNAQSFIDQLSLGEKAIMSTILTGLQMKTDNYNERLDNLRFIRNTLQRKNVC